MIVTVTVTMTVVMIIMIIMIMVMMSVIMSVIVIMRMHGLMIMGVIFRWLPKNGLAVRRAATAGSAHNTSILDLFFHSKIHIKDEQQSNV